MRASGGAWLTVHSLAHSLSVWRDKGHAKLAHVTSRVDITQRKVVGLQWTEERIAFMRVHTHTHTHIHTHTHTRCLSISLSVCLSVTHKHIGAKPRTGEVDHGLRPSTRLKATTHRQRERERRERTHYPLPKDVRIAFVSVSAYRYLRFGSDWPYSCEVT